MLLFTQKQFGYLSGSFHKPWAVIKAQSRFVFKALCSLNTALMIAFTVNQIQALRVKSAAGIKGTLGGLVAVFIVFVCKL